MADARCSRRDMLRSVIVGAGASLAGATLVDFASPRLLGAQTNLSPADALQELIAGNQRCVANQLTSIQQDLEVLRTHTADKQEAAITAEPVPGQISVLYAPLHRAVEHSRGDLARAIEINAGVQAELLRTSSTVIRDALKAGKVSVASGVYDLSTGKVSLA